jgi:hypothetical protein
MDPYVTMRGLEERKVMDGLHLRPHTLKIYLQAAAD